ncbi:hypothetical protein [Mycobacterium tuberculosis]|uniref:hypothetical protein n=1 Tax=Mycobacterium tuberculosis TaxID=1773 RepID=UPI00272B7C75|nr:hypothetical protein [Mycobacterium tuberculosis]
MTHPADTAERRFGGLARLYGVTGAQRLVAFAAIVAGAVLGFRYQMWRLERMA